MTNLRIADLTAITTIANTADLLHFIDVTDTTYSTLGTDKKMTVANLNTYLAQVAMTLTNKTLDTAGAGNVLKVNGTTLSAVTGTGSLVLGTNPTIAKPILNATNPTAQTYTPVGGATATLDLSLANQHYITMPAGNITIALSNDTNNQIFYVSITQDGVGSRTVTWFTTIRWAGGSAPTLTTTASKRDGFIFVRTGTATYDGYVVGQSV